MKKSELKAIILECIKEELLNEGNLPGQIKQYDKEVQKVAKAIDVEFSKDDEIIWNGAYYDDHTIYITFGLDPYDESVVSAKKAVKKLQSKFKNFTWKLVKYAPKEAEETLIVNGWG